MLQLLLFFTLHSRTITIVHQIFEPQLFSSTQRVFIQDWLNSFWTACLYTRLTEFLLNRRNLLCLACYTAKYAVWWMHLKENVSASRNLYKCKQVACRVVLVWFYPFFILQFVVECLLLNLPFFILILLLYFCLFINHGNKSISFVFGAFGFHFMNTISIFVDWL